MTEPTVDLAIEEIAVGARELALSYTLTNSGTATAYAVNRLFHRERGGFRVDTDLVYADVEDGVLNLRKHMVEVPDEIDVEAPEVPYVTAVAPGEVFGERVTIAVPVVLRHPYVQQQAAEADAARLLVGVVVSPEREPRAVGEELRLAYRDVVRGQRILGSEPRMLPGPLRTVSG